MDAKQPQKQGMRMHATHERVRVCMCVVRARQLTARPYLSRQLSHQAASKGRADEANTYIHAHASAPALPHGWRGNSWSACHHIIKHLQRAISIAHP
eukprot:1159674-Pelagomonas_calceolata.AAC.8